MSRLHENNSFGFKANSLQVDIHLVYVAACKIFLFKVAMQFYHYTTEDDNFLN
jgi:hypothetical protein